MDKNLCLLTEKLCELYDAYEDYAFNSYVHNDNRYLLIIRFGNGGLISYLLFDNISDHLVDDVHIDFEHQEYDLFYALALRLFVKSLGDTMIHKLDDNTYGNSIRKPYVQVVTDDTYLLNMFDELIKNQEKEYLNLDNMLVEKESKKVKVRHFDRQLINQIEDRTALTKELFRGW